MALLYATPLPASRFRRVPAQTSSKRTCQNSRNEGEDLTKSTRTHIHCLPDFTSRTRPTSGSRLTSRPLGVSPTTTWP